MLLFPGRTEYIEKYGRTAGDLADLGFSTIAIDWRGQGLADRALDDRNTGHVMHFIDYQQDVAVLLDTARAHDLPEPYFLLAHSMGGCIGLRALMQGLPVKAAVFTAPMWGIAMTGLLRPIAWTMSWAARTARIGHVYTPGTKAETYVKDAAIRRQRADHRPRDVRLHAASGPRPPRSGAWAAPACTGCTRRCWKPATWPREPAPEVPTLTFLGTNERVVDTAPIQDRMRDWTAGRLEMVEGAEHEVLMERPAIRAHVLKELDALFTASA